MIKILFLDFYFDEIEMIAYFLYETIWDSSNLF